MGRIITIEKGDKTYTLEFNRRTLLLATDIQEKVNKANTNASRYTALCEFIRIAFLKNHPDIEQAEVDDLIESIDDFNGFIEALTKIMEASVEVLKQEKGNVKWVVN